MTTALPSQIRAARALINWSQEQLAEASGVGVSTIRDFESGRRDSLPANIEALCIALLRKGGVELLADNHEHGPGVRMVRDSVKLVEKPRSIDFYSDNLTFVVSWRGEKIDTLLPRSIIEDWMRAERLSDRECLNVFADKESEILARCARAIYAGRVNDRGHLQLRANDFRDVL